MIELLKLCGFEEHEINSDLPRIGEVFNRLGITAEDIGRAKQRLNKYYDMKLQGVRKLLRLYVRELVNLVLAREEGKTKIIYGIMGVGLDTVGSAFVSKSKEVYVTYPGDIFEIVLGCIFGKLVPILEAAESKWLKAGAVAHCANPKTLLGMLALNLVPRPDLVASSGFLCDTAPKTMDLLSELYDIPTCCYDSCQDREFRDYPDAKRITDLAARSMRRVTERVQEIVGFEITDEILLKAMYTRHDLTVTTAKLLDLLECSDPLPLSATHLILLSCIGGLSIDATNLPSLVDAANTLYGELQERVSKKLGVVERGAPRIIALLPPHSTDPRLEHLIGEVGMALVAFEGRFHAPYGGNIPNATRPKDPYELMMSRHLQRSMCNSLKARIRILIEICQRLKVDGVLCRYHVGCRVGAGDAIIIKDAITKELGLPVLLFEWESFDPRVYNHEQDKSRLEVFKQMMLKS